MNKKTKPENKTPKKLKKLSNEDKDDLLVNDQNKRGYYYDDAHGYEVYDPEKDDENDEDSK